MLYRIFQGLLFAPVALSLHDCPMPKCSACLSLSQHDAPGIGVDLTSGYGTSAVHFYNGTTLDVAKVEAGQEYKDLFLHLSKSPPAPRSDWDLLKRWLNKKLGRPATPEIGILGDFLRQLYLNTQDTLGGIDNANTATVVVSTPLFPALPQEDLTDALEYAGLGSWLTLPFPYPQRLSSSRAVFGANGLGLCRNYKDLYECEDEYEEMPMEEVYFVSLTRHALYISRDGYRAAFGLDAGIERYILDPMAGMDSLSQYGSSEKFWSRVGGQLETLTCPPREFPTKALLAGENATNPAFLRVLREAFERVRFQDPGQQASGPVSVPESLDIEMMADPVFAAARGAALYARWRQEAPFDCVERRECELERRRDREGSPLSEARGEL